MYKKDQQQIIKQLAKQRDSVFARFPLVFTLLGTLGVTITYFGLQHLLDKIPLIANNPYIAVVVGLGILVGTGSLYKKLG